MREVYPSTRRSTSTDAEAGTSTASLYRSGPEFRVSVLLAGARHPLHHARSGLTSLTGSTRRGSQAPPLAARRVRHLGLDVPGDPRRGGRAAADAEREPALRGGRARDAAARAPPGRLVAG